MLERSYTVQQRGASHAPTARSTSRRVINVVVGVTPRTIFLGEHNNLIIITYDDDLLLCDQTFDVVNTTEQTFVDVGQALELRGDTEKYITIAAASVSTRVRIIVW